MPWFTRWYFLLCRLLVAPIIRLVHPSLIQLDDQLLEQLEGKPVCYVLRRHSWTDRFLLERLARQQGLPVLGARPGTLPDQERATCLYLPVLKGDSKRNQQPLQALIDSLGKREAPEDYPLQIVPVSIFWGRDPGSETSFWRLLLGDGERGGALRKMLVMIAQRNNVLIHFAQPLDFNALVARKEQDAREAARTLARTLSFYYSRRKVATLGPSLLSRGQIISMVMRRPAVSAAIDELAANEGESRAKLEKSARKMADEVAANFDSRLLRVLDLILTWVFRKLFTGLRVHHADRLRRAANDRQLVYMPSHRSHFDYLLISYALYKQGLVPPHIAAGINLNFWPVGGLLRRGGAFYIRRKFGGDKLYSAVFKSYLGVILSRGYPMEFFPEGGRSRTGRLLPPKLGMLKMTLESCLQQPGRKVAIVPIYVGYDKLVEGASYVKELRGAGKTKESAGSLLKARRIFKTSYGSPHVAFGAPISLEECLSRVCGNWRQQAQAGDFGFLPEAIQHIAQENMTRINAAAVVNPIGLVAMILLSSPQRAMAEQELLAQIDYFIALLRRRPYSQDMVLPEGDAREIFEQAARTAGLSRIEHPWGPIITATGREAVLLTYYRNSVMHVLALPSLIARFFRHVEQVEQSSLVAACADMLPFLQGELFLRVEAEDFSAEVAEHIDQLVDLQLLKRDGETLSRPDVGTMAFAVLTGLGRILRETLERYTMSSLLLARTPGTEAAPRLDVENQIIEMAQRLAILSGREAPEYFDKNLFKVYIDTLISEGLLQSEPRDDEAWIWSDGRLSQHAQRWVNLLGPDVQQSMLQLIARPDAPV